MKIGYFDAAFCGASGDMIAASLLDAGLSLSRLKAELAKIDLNGYRLSLRKEERFDPRIGHSRPVRRFQVLLPQKKPSLPPTKICQKILASGLEESDKEKICAIFTVLAEAEKKVHQKLPVHFHQVGELDSIVDVVTAVVGLRLLGVENLYASTLNLGSPAPATTILCQGKPVVVNADQPECTTPTAAAILTKLALFQPPPPFRLTASGSGAGSRREPVPNILNFFSGERLEGVCRDRVVVVETNIDDLPPYAYEEVFESLWKVGVLDIILLPGLMKKSRPGQKLEILTKTEDIVRVLEVLFTKTTTFGVRLRETERVVLERRFQKTTVAGKPVRLKIGYYQGRVVQKRPEYEDLKAAFAQKKEKKS